MEEETENNNPITPDRSFKKEEEKAEWRVRAYAEFKEQLEKDERFVEWAKEFNAYSVESFIKDFAKKKIRWHEWGGRYKEWQERDELKWQEQAFLLLHQIQQKKLFDLQCQWRAEKIHLSGISTTYDFLIWENDVFSCPFLEPVTEEEADLYLAYLNSADYEFVPYGMQWQDYTKIRKAYEQEDSHEHFPEWYAFVDSRRGTGFYLTLPDIRGEKENFYITLCREHRAKNPPPQKDAPPAAPQPDKKPFLNYTNKGYLDWFIKTFETPETFNFYKAVQADSMDQAGEMEEMVTDALEMLSKADRILPIKKSDDWRESIFATAKEYNRMKTAESFPEAYEEYQMKVQNGLGLPQAGMDIGFMLRQLTYQARMNEILEGRRLNGEPQDFNF